EDADLGLVQGAIRLSSHVLARDKSQLRGQLHGRLLSSDVPAIQEFLSRPDPPEAVPWLRPLTSSLTPPGGAMLRTLARHAAWVPAVAVTPDGHPAASASSDKTLKVWDLHSGVALRTLAGHSYWVNAVAVTPDGRHVVSASDDQTLKVWDLHSGVAL